MDMIAKIFSFFDWRAKGRVKGDEVPDDVSMGIEGRNRNRRKPPDLEPRILRESDTSKLSRE